MVRGMLAAFVTEWNVYTRGRNVNLAARRIWIPQGVALSGIPGRLYMQMGYLIERLGFRIFPGSLSDAKIFDDKWAKEIRGGVAVRRYNGMKPDGTLDRGCEGGAWEVLGTFR